MGLGKDALFYNLREIAAKSNNMARAFQVFVAIEGIVSTLFCVYLFFFFVRSRHQIARAVGFDKMAEAVLSAATLLFTFFAQGVWDVYLSDNMVSLIRFVMFTTSLCCSIHLMIATMRIIRKGNANE